MKLLDFTFVADLIGIAHAKMQEMYSQPIFNDLEFQNNSIIVSKYRQIWLPI